MLMLTNYLLYTGKIETMKNYIIYILIALTIASCGTGEPMDNPQIDYTIKNVSMHSVKIKVFDAEIDNVYGDTTFLFPSINSEISYSSHGGIIYVFGGSEDSVYVIFNDTLRIIYRRDDLNPRNIIDINSWTGGEVNDNLYKYEYLITDEDYENAENIE